MGQDGSALMTHQHRACSVLAFSVPIATLLVCAIFAPIAAQDTRQTGSPLSETYTPRTVDATTKPGQPWTMPPAPPGVEIQKDLSYLAEGRQEKLDLYLPSNRAAGARAPAVVVIHGGGWTTGDKARQREFLTGTTLALAGYVAISIEYMKESGKRWPTNLHDCKNAVRWLRVNAAKLQVDAAHIGVIGGSAGGHLALMVGYTTGVKELEPDGPYPGVSDRVQAVVDMYGVTNLLTRQATEKDGTPNGQLREAGLFPNKRGENIDKWKLASPVYHVSKDSPPTLILHGTADPTVDRDQSYELGKTLKEAGVPHRLIMLQGIGHTFALLDKGVDVREVVVVFFNTYLKPAK